MPEPMARITFLLTQDLESPSGLGRYGPLARELASLGHPVRVFALHPAYQDLQPGQRAWRDGNLQVEYVAPMHVQKHGNQKTYYGSFALGWIILRATFALLRAALRERCDILWVGKPHPMNGIAGVCAHLIQRNRLLVDCDDYEPGTNRFTGRWQRKTVQFFERWVSKKAGWVTTNTHFTQQRLEGFGIPANRIIYLPNGMDRARFIPPPGEVLARLRRELQLEGAPVVLYLGTLSRQSHHLSLLLQAFRRVREALPGVVLLLVGGGEDFPSLQAEADQLGLRESARFTGRIPPAQVVNYYSLGSVAVDPVLDEDVARGRAPLKMMEAFACGIPFVTADVGDRRSLAGDPPAALLASAADADGLAQAILSVLRDPALARELSRRGLERSLSFEWKRLAQELETTHQAALGPG